MRRLVVRALPLVAATSVLVNFQTRHRVSCESVIEEPDSSFFKGWKKDKIGEYENRLRFYSHPYKVFNYFASVKKGDQKYMTAKDLIRSLLPFRKFASNKYNRVPSAEMFFQLADTDGGVFLITLDGLIGFSEYIMFLTLLATPEFHWKIAFKLFDINGDGTVSKEEFQKIMSHATSELALGQRMGKNERNFNVSEAGLSRMFFGAKGDKDLTFDVFSDFMQRLHMEILKLEFYQFDVEKSSNSISLKDFGSSLLTFINPKDHSRYEERINSLESTQERVSFDQFFAFDQMIRTRLHDLEMAYRFYTAMHPRGFDQVEFKRIVKTVTKCQLTDGQVNMIYSIFDSNQDGQLDQFEFLNALKNRRSNGMQTNRDLAVGLTVISLGYMLKTLLDGDRTGFQLSQRYRVGIFRLIQGAQALALGIFAAGAWFKNLPADSRELEERKAN